MESWSLTTIREKVVKIGAKVIAHARCAVFQMAEVALFCRQSGAAGPPKREMSDGTERPR